MVAETNKDSFISQNKGVQKLVTTNVGLATQCNYQGPDVQSFPPTISSTLCTLLFIFIMITGHKCLQKLQAAYLHIIKEKKKGTGPNVPFTRENRKGSQKPVGRTSHWLELGSISTLAAGAAGKVNVWLPLYLGRQKGERSLQLALPVNALPITGFHHSIFANERISLGFHFHTTKCHVKGCCDDNEIKIRTSLQMSGYINKLDR